MECNQKQKDKCLDIFLYYVCIYSVTVNSSVLITLILVLQYHDTILIIIFDYQGTCNFITIRGHHAESK